MFIKNNKLFIVSGVGFFLFSLIESWRNTRLTGSEEDLVFSYTTYIAVCIIIMLYCFFAVLARYRSKYNKQHRLLKTIYIPVMISLMFLGYYLGLNMDSILGNANSTGFFFIMPVWGHVVLLPIVLYIYGYFIWKNGSRKRLNIFITLIVSLALLLMLSTVVSSFASQFDIFS